MMWPLPESHGIYVEQTKAQAHAIVSHLKAVSCGKAPFQQDGRGESKTLTPSISDPENDIQAYTKSLNEELDAVGNSDTKSSLKGLANI